MTLTQEDLQAIGGLIDQRLDSRLKPIEGKIGLMEKQLGSLASEQKKQGRDITQIKKAQDTMLNMLDSEQMRQRKQIKRIEEHLNLPPLAQH